MRLFNTLTGREEAYASDTLKMYVCGITPYDTTHLGHAYTYVTFDVLARYLKHLGKKVTYVQNVTDIDDDILRKAGEVGEDWQALGRRHVKRFVDDNRALNNVPPDFYPNASDHIAEIDEINTDLVARGFAYEAGGNVYFRSSRGRFGALSRLPEARQVEIASTRGNDALDKHKEQPLDFVLWLAKRPGEPFWPSTFGDGRPGWHIECTAIGLKHIGPTLDVHGGGSDLMFPHHEAEIAQSEAHTGKTFSRFWVHVGMLRYQGEKMSKSLGNMVFVSDLLKSYSPNAIRLALLAHHYRTEWEYTDADIKRAQDLASSLHEGGAESVDVPALRDEFNAALADDLDTPRAIRALTQIARGGGSEARVEAGRLASLLGLVVRDGRTAA